MTSPDRDAAPADWRMRRFSCDHWGDLPGQVWSNFVHDTDELVVVVGGDVELEIAGVIRRRRAGQTALIPAGVRHTARNLGTAEWRRLYGYRRTNSSRSWADSERRDQGTEEP